MDQASKKERETFREALNSRIAVDYPDTRGRPQWLHSRLSEYRKRNQRMPTVSVATCAYWLKGEKIPKHEHVALLCAALGVTRGQLFGESEDPRLAEVITAWSLSDENLRDYVYSVVVGRKKAVAPEPGPVKKTATK